MYRPLVVPLPPAVRELVARVEASRAPLAVLEVALVGYRVHVQETRDIGARARRWAGQRIGGHEHRVLLRQVEKVWPSVWRQNLAELRGHLGDGSWRYIWQDAVAATLARDRLNEPEYRLLMAPMLVVLDPPDWATEQDWVKLWAELTTTRGLDAARAAVSALVGNAPS